MGADALEVITEEPETGRSGLQFVDDIFVAFLEQKKGMKGKPRWLAMIRQNPQYSMILDNRLRTSSRQLAKMLNVPLEELYRLEQEIFQSYYADFHIGSHR